VQVVADYYVESLVVMYRVCEGDLADTERMKIASVFHESRPFFFLWLYGRPDPGDTKQGSRFYTVAKWRRLLRAFDLEADVAARGGGHGISSVEASRGDVV